MMRNLGINMQVTCTVSLLMDILKANRKNHIQILKEAKAGYLAKAEEVLAARLVEIRDGKTVGLDFGLYVPKSWVTAYDTVITMLTMHTEKTIVMSASEVQMLVEDEWDWADRFLISNSVYSRTSFDAASGKGLL